MFHSYANLYFNVFILILVVLFLDGIRELRKYSSEHDSIDITQANPGADIAIHMKLFRAQRNFYIAGFSLFLIFVLRRLVTLLSREARLEAENEAVKRQAQSATAAAKQMLEEQDNKNNEEQDKETKARLDKAQSQIMKLQEEVGKALADKDAMKKQAVSTNTEYDRLLEEHAKLQEQITKLQGQEGTKKDD